MLEHARALRRFCFCAVIAMAIAGTAHAQPFAYITNHGDNTVTVIDTSNDQVVGPPILVGIRPLGVAVHPTGTHVYVANVGEPGTGGGPGNGSVSVIRTGYGAVGAATVTNTFSLDGNVRGIAIHPDGRRLYVVGHNANSGILIIIDLSASLETGTITYLPIGAPIGSGLWGVAVRPDGTRIYVVGNRHVLAINTNSMDPANWNAYSIPPVTLDGYSTGIAISPSDRRVYVRVTEQEPDVSAAPTGTYVSVIADDHAPPAQIGPQLNASAIGLGVAVNADGTRAYAATHAGTLKTIERDGSPDRYKVMETNLAGVGNNPAGIAVHPDGSRVYVVNSGPWPGNVYKVSVININTGDAYHVETGAQPMALGQFIGPDVPGKPMLSGTPGDGQATFVVTLPAGSPPAAGYIVTCISALHGVVVGKNPGTTVVVENMVNGANYSCSAEAYNGAGTGARSDSISVKPIGRPDPPWNVSVTPGIRQATVTFSPPFNTGGAGLIRFDATCTSNAPPPPDAKTMSITLDAPPQTGTVLSIVIPNMLAGRTYICSVTATNAAELTSLPSLGVPVTLPRPPLEPTNVSATRGDGQATIVFQQPAWDGGLPIDQYRVFCGIPSAPRQHMSQPVAPQAADIQSVSVGELINGTAYSCRAQAHNAVDWGDESDSSPVTPAGRPGGPRVRVTPGVDSATFSFQGPTADNGAPIDHYTVTCNPGPLVKTGSLLGSPITGITVTEMTSCTTYNCLVTAHNSAGDGEPANIQTTPGRVPDPPVATSVLSGNRSATVAFTAAVTAPVGACPVIDYAATCDPGANGVSRTSSSIASSPTTVTELINNTRYDCSVKAHNIIGRSGASNALSVIPRAPWCQQFPRVPGCGGP